MIQAVLPSSKLIEDDDMEIPIDELDTYTLRKLQEYVLVREDIRDAVSP